LSGRPTRRLVEDARMGTLYFCSHIFAATITTTGRLRIRSDPILSFRVGAPKGGGEEKLFFSSCWKVLSSVLRAAFFHLVPLRMKYE